MSIGWHYMGHMAPGWFTYSTSWSVVIPVTYERDWNVGKKKKKNTGKNVPNREINELGLCNSTVAGGGPCSL